MVRKEKWFHGLKWAKIRQDWNKYNLYNISRFKTPVKHMQTYFQQKWAAKAQARAYHGETVLEKHWNRTFSPHVRAVLPMNPKVLAKGDGSEQAEGRGAGLGIRRGEMMFKKMPKLPYMNMAFAGLERRLDVAVWRALFASSTRQARQFCVHGYVKVNGKKMVYPAYKLNPGDMFQVDPERVMFATGAPKTPEQATVKRRVSKESAEGLEEASEEPAELAEAAPAEPEPVADPRTTLKELLSKAKSVIGTDPSASAKRKQDLRAFQRLVRTTLSRPAGAATAAAQDLDGQLAELTGRLNITTSEAPAGSRQGPASTPGRSLTITNAERRQLEGALREARENPLDSSKTYATPWRPRDYMSAFAFIPRYLEVNHRICSAVYVRHPVARPGLGEVPTPFPEEVLGLAFNWYLRRR